jgi:outer membrane murein-binding lipoprotein Lpp
MLPHRRRTPILLVAALLAATLVGGCASTPTVPSGRPQSSAALRVQVSRLHAQANTLRR